MQISEKEWSTLSDAEKETLVQKIATGNTQHSTRDEFGERVWGAVTDFADQLNGKFSTDAGWIEKDPKTGEMVFKERTCFVAGTLVHTKDGLKKIEEIQVGDEVLSWNEKTGQNSYKKVTELFVHDVELLFDVEIGEDTILQTTWNHPFWVVEKNAWVEVKDLKVGDIVLLSDGSQTSVTGVRYYEVPSTKVYNVEVEENHTYYVGEEGVLVHNYDVNRKWKEVTDSMRDYDKIDSANEDTAFSLLLTGLKNVPFIGSLFSAGDKAKIFNGLKKALEQNNNFSKDTSELYDDILRQEKESFKMAVIDTAVESDALDSQIRESQKRFDTLMETLPAGMKKQLTYEHNQHLASLIDKVRGLEKEKDRLVIVSNQLDRSEELINRLKNGDAKTSSNKVEKQLSYLIEDAYGKNSERYQTHQEEVKAINAVKNSYKYKLAYDTITSAVGLGIDIKNPKVDAALSIATSVYKQGDVRLNNLGDRLNDYMKVRSERQESEDYSQNGMISRIRNVYGRGTWNPYEKYEKYNLLKPLVGVK